MVVINAAGLIVNVNARAGDMFGYPDEALIGQPIETLMPKRFAQRHQALQQSYFTDPKARNMGSGLELYGAKQDGTEFPVEISLSPLHTELGMMAISAIRDVTERKQMFYPTTLLQSLR